MTHEFQPRPLPDENDYAAAADAVQKTMDRKGLDAKLYLTAYGLASDSTKEFTRNAALLANSVELTNSETGAYSDIQRRRGRALYLGAVAGYSILREIYGVSLPSGAMLEYIPPMTVSTFEGDPERNTNALHEAVVKLGLHGNEMLGSRAVRTVAHWSEQAVSRPEYRPTFIAGSGLITLAGIGMQEQRIEQFQITQLHDHVESNETFDWDAALVNLNSKEM